MVLFEIASKFVYSEKTLEKIMINENMKNKEIKMLNSRTHLSKVAIDIIDGFLQF